MRFARDLLNKAFLSLNYLSNSGIIRSEKGTLLSQYFSLAGFVATSLHFAFDSKDEKRRQSNKILRLNAFAQAVVGIYLGSIDLLKNLLENDHQRDFLWPAYQALVLTYIPWLINEFSEKNIKKSGPSIINILLNTFLMIFSEGAVYSLHMNSKVSITTTLLTCSAISGLLSLSILTKRIYVMDPSFENTNYINFLSDDEFYELSSPQEDSNVEDIVLLNTSQSSYF